MPTALRHELNPSACFDGPSLEAGFGCEADGDTSIPSAPSAGPLIEKCHPPAESAAGAACVNRLRGPVFHSRLNLRKMEQMIRSTLWTFTKQTIGRVRRRTSTTQRSITLVVSSFRHKYRGRRRTTATQASPAGTAGPSRVLSEPTRAESTEGGFGRGLAEEHDDGGDRSAEVR